MWTRTFLRPDLRVHPHTCGAAGMNKRKPRPAIHSWPYSIGPGHRPGSALSGVCRIRVSDEHRLSWGSRRHSADLGLIFCQSRIKHQPEQGSCRADPLRLGLAHLPATCRCIHTPTLPLPFLSLFSHGVTLVQESGSSMTTRRKPKTALITTVSPGLKGCRR